MNKLKVTQKENKILNLLLTNTVTKKYFPSNKKDWNEFEKKQNNNNKKIVVLNILNVPYSTEEIRHADKIKE